MAEDKRSHIERAAYALFSSKGIAATSYSAIAAASGEGRSLVQYYFPSKSELVVGFIGSCLAQIANSPLIGANAAPELRTLYTGQLYFALLLADAGMVTFTRDMLADRALTSQVIELNAERTLPDEGESAILLESSVKATGGVYELLMRKLDNGGEIDATDLAVQNVAAYLAFSQDERYSEAAGRLRGESLPDADVKKAAAQMAAAFRS